MVIYSYDTLSISTAERSSELHAENMSLYTTIDDCIGYTFTYAVAKPTEIKLSQASILVYLSAQHCKLHIDHLHVYQLYHA